MILFLFLFLFLAAFSIKEVISSYPHSSFILDSSTKNMNIFINYLITKRKTTFEDSVTKDFYLEIFLFLQPKNKSKNKFLYLLISIFDSPKNFSIK